MKYQNNNPNLSIILPGKCNAKCSFCFNKHQTQMPMPKIDSYRERIKGILRNVPSNFTQISITGGEPTMSPYLDMVLSLIDNNKFPHTVLTTNGSYLANWIDRISYSIKHINISRHHYDGLINRKAFGSDVSYIPNVPKTKKLKEIIIKCNQKGIDVSLSAVLTEWLDSVEHIHAYLRYAKEIGASAVQFRIPAGTLNTHHIENAFSEGYKYSEHSCGVCRSRTMIINGINVTWKASLMETFKTSGDIYEAIVQPDGKLTSDWAGNNNISHILETSNEPGFVNYKPSQLVLPAVEQYRNGSSDGVSDQAFNDYLSHFKKEEIEPNVSFHDIGCGSSKGNGCHVASNPSTGCVRSASGC